MKTKTRPRKKTQGHIQKQKATKKNDERRKTNHERRKTNHERRKTKKKKPWPLIGPFQLFCSWFEYEGRIIHQKK